MIVVALLFLTMPSFLPKIDEYFKLNPEIFRKSASFNKPIIVDSFRITLTDAVMSDEIPEFDYSRSSDTRSPLERMAASFGAGLGKGLAKGIFGGESEAEDADTYLAVYLTIENLRERAKKPDDFNISLIDEKGTEYEVSSVDFTFGHTPIRPNKTYEEMMLFRVFSDAKEFKLTINDYVYYFIPRKIEDKSQ
jgi:hypothetical protein